MEGTSEDEVTSINPLDLFVSSIDTLRSTPIDQSIPPNGGWAARPTRSSGLASASREEVRELCRTGIPSCLRCAAWIINVFSVSLPQSEADEYGTLGKVKVLDHGWNLVTRSLFPDESDVERAEVLDFGLGDHLISVLTGDHGGEIIPEGGIKSLTLVLHGIRDSLGVVSSKMEVTMIRFK
jgi:hypothetical protein